MKKQKKWIAAFLAGCCLTLCACDKVPADQEKTTEEKVEQVYTFEEAIRPVGMNSNFGVLDIETDPQYVSEGKKSLKLTPMADNKDELYVYFPFLSDILGIDYSNLMKLKSVILDVYTDQELQINCGMYFSKSAELRAEATPVKLQKGWNKVEVPIVHSLIAVQYDPSNCNGFYIQFESGVADTNVSVYVDNLCVKDATEKIVLEDVVFLDEWDGYWELADFEHSYQQILATPVSNYGRSDLPVVSVVKASDYGLEAPSGENVLRIETFPCNKDYGVGQSWTQLFFADKWLEVLDISRFSDAENYVLKFDVYQEGDVSSIIELNLYHSYGMDWGGMTTQKGKWIEYSGSLSNFKNFIENPSSFAFAWLDWDPSIADSCVYYMDNIRIERVG